MPDEVDDEIVFAAARDSGTLNDRAQLALQEVDRVLTRRGLVAQELRLSGGSHAGRLIGGLSEQSLAIFLAVARDALDEVQTATSLSALC